MRVFSFCHLKWRHLVNRLPLYNAVLKLQFNGVGRRFELYGNMNVMLVEAVASVNCQQSVSPPEGSWPRITARHHSVQDAAVKSERCNNKARRPTSPNALCNVT